MNYTIPKIFGILLLILLSFSSCSTVKTRSSHVVFSVLTETPTIHLSRISITDSRGIDGDSERVKNFLVGIASQTEIPLNTNAEEKYAFSIDIKESQFNQKLEQIFALVITISVVEINTDTLLYQGLLIYESERSITSADLLYSLLEEAYSNMAISLTLVNSE